MGQARVLVVEGEGEADRSRVIDPEGDDHGQSKRAPRAGESTVRGVISIVSTPEGPAVASLT